MNMRTTRAAMANICTVFICGFICLCLLVGRVAGGTFWQVTDIHVDDSYIARSEPSSYCHHDNPTTEEKWFGQNGCGLPWTTVESAADFMVQTEPNPDFIVWTGDTAPYWPYPDWGYVFSKLNRASRMLRDRFAATPIYPAIGNHDSYPSDQFPLDNVTFYEEYLNRSGWTDLLDEQARRTFAIGGYYMAQPSEGLKVIVLNTNLYYSNNKLFDDNHSENDPTGQIDWLRETLHDLEQNEPESRVIIVAHISPGFPHWSAEETSLDSMVNKKLIDVLSEPKQLKMRLGHVFGHEHMDTFKVASAKFAESQNVFLMSPAVYPGSGHLDTNPGVRLYTYTQHTLKDYHQYHFDLKSANEAHRSDSNTSARSFWKLTYKASERYELTDLGAKSMSKLLQRMKNDEGVFRKYWSMTDGGYKDTPCDNDCKQQRFCIMESLNSDEMQQCLTNSVNFFHTKLSTGICTLVVCFVLTLVNRAHLLR